MNMFVRFTVAVTLGLLIASCVGTASQVVTSPSPTMISLERTLCYGRCPVYSITIYGDGTVRYEGKEHVNVKGSQTRVVNHERVRQLVAEFEQAGYFSMNDAYTAYMITDAPSAITSITIDGRTKRVRHYLGDRTAPKELMLLENRIDEVAGSREWVGSPLEAQDMRVQPPGKSAADGLWEQGKILYAQKQYTEALDRFKQSIFQWSNPERADYVRQMEAFVAQNKARAKQLRDEAYALQQQGNTRLAVDKYRESLKIWPDRQLEEYVARLERGPGPSSAGSQPPRDERFCGPVDWGAAVPADFAITYTSGPTHAEWGSRRVEKVYANGDTVIEEIPPCEAANRRRLRIASRWWSSACLRRGSSGSTPAWRVRILRPERALLEPEHTGRRRREHHGHRQWQDTTGNGLLLRRAEVRLHPLRDA